MQKVTIQHNPLFDLPGVDDKAITITLGDNWTWTTTKKYNRRKQKKKTDRGRKPVLPYIAGLDPIEPEPEAMTDRMKALQILYNVTSQKLLKEMNSFSEKK